MFFLALIYCLLRFLSTDGSRYGPLLNIPVQDNYIFPQPGIQKKVGRLAELISRVDGWFPGLCEDFVLTFFLFFFFLQPHCTSILSYTMWNIFSSPFDGLIVFWWESCHWTVLFVCGTVTRYSGFWVLFTSLYQCSILLSAILPLWWSVIFDFSYPYPGRGWWFQWIAPVCMCFVSCSLVQGIEGSEGLSGKFFLEIP